METYNFDLLETNNSMTDFYFFRNYFNDEKINKVINLTKNLPIVEGNVSGVIDKKYRTSQIKWIPFNDESKWLYDDMVKLSKIANNDMWKFHITNIKDDIQFTEYRSEDEGHYDWHLDFGGSRSSTRKLSMVIQLSDPDSYTGGELQFKFNRNTINAPNDKGTVIFFPSYLLHRVKKVESGIRNSLVCWLHGPPFV